MKALVLSEFGRVLEMHYLNHLGPEYWVCEEAASPLGGPLSWYVLEFPPRPNNADWTYVTLGVSQFAMSGVDSRYRVEFLMYSATQNDAVPEFLARLSSYPFFHDTFLSIGHLVPGEEDIGVVPGSPIPDVLLTPCYFERAEFDLLYRDNGTETQILSPLPIYRSELVFAKAHGWRSLVEEKLVGSNLCPGDFWRNAVV